MTERSRRLDELLALRAIEGLDERAQAELEAALDAAPAADAEALDRAAAAVHLAMLTGTEAMPAALRAKLDDDAARLFGGPPEKRPPQT